MVRVVYILLTTLAAPVAFMIQLWKGLSDRRYLDRAGERFGFTAPTGRPTLWLHAVSVGEVRAAAIMVPGIRERWPGLSIVVTTTTPTGASQVQALLGDSVRHVYLPFDTGGAVRRFLDAIEPRAGIIMETELWPTLYLECGRRGIPLTIASARLSARSVRRYAPFASLSRRVFAGDVVVAAQSAVDAERYRSLGARTGLTHVTGNVKFDMAIAPSVLAAGGRLKQWLSARPAWVAGSTREGEEAVLLDAEQLVGARHPTSLLVLVPRHPQRFAEVSALLEARGVPYVTRTSGTPPGPGTRVLLVDTLGELLDFYAAARVAFVGGTLVPIGGHNLLEPACIGLPVLHGPHVFNAPDIARVLDEAGAAIEVHSAKELALGVVRLLDDPEECQRRGEAGRQAVQANGGAVNKVLDLVAARLDAVTFRA